MSGEQIFYARAGVTISNTRAVFPNGKLYSMANVTSVDTRMKKPAYLLPGLVMVFGLAGAIVSLANLSVEGIAGGAVVLAIGVVWAMLLKTLYAVNLTSASGEAEPIVSDDKDFIRSVVQAISEAIIHRG